MCATDNRRLQYLLAFLICINLLTPTLGQVKECKDFGGYCLNHWDCCSNTCMNYLYKCTRPKPANPYPNQMTYEELVEEHFGKPTEGGNELEEPKEFQSRFGEPLVEVRQLDSPETAPAAASTTTAPIIVTEESTTASSSAAPSCGEIGDKCFRPSGCCPHLRCHGFLHQCVT